MFNSRTDGKGVGRLARQEMPGLLTDIGLYREARLEKSRIIAIREDGTEEVLVMGSRRLSSTEQATSNMTHIPNDRLDAAFEETGIRAGAIFLVLDAPGTILTITVLPKEAIDRLLLLNSFLTQEGTLLMRYEKGFEQVVKENAGRVVMFHSTVL
ncbi:MULTISPECIES: hypothetical protein [Glutamicibacter]|uniref:hypothetical protein n=1 Tax=Glutamicibacter TaxID=1742989 RepID=UPI0005A038DB|nr:MULTISPECIES: hypothetical protein [Glutamicibacter]HCH47060.1 hypothetical protein [Glutamicibacter sp.]